MIDLDMVSDTDGWWILEYAQFMHYDGTAWETIPYSQSADIKEFTALDMVDEHDGWAFGYRNNNDLVSLQYHGNAWNVVDIEPLAWNPLASVYGVHMLNNNLGWAVGAGVDAGFALYFDGDTWHEATLPQVDSLTDVHVISKNDVWAVGSEILHYDGTN